MFIYLIENIVKKYIHKNLSFIHTSFFKRPDSDDAGIKDLAIAQQVIATAGPPI